MRIGQLQSLTEYELSLLLYIVNKVDTISIPKIEIGPKELLWIKHDVLLWKLAKQESKLTPEGKFIFKGLMTKLNSPIPLEFFDNNNNKEQQLELPLKYECTTNSVFIQPDFQF